MKVIFQRIRASLTDTYKLPKIFAGEMKIDVKYADIVSHSETVEVYSEKS